MIKYKQDNFPNKVIKVKLDQKGLSNCHSFGLDINSVIYDEEKYTRALSEKISVIDETLPFKDSMGWYTIDTKLKPKPVSTLVQSERDCDLWLKLMNTNSGFKSWFNCFARNMLKLSREHNKDRDVVLYYPDTEHGKQINQNFNFIFNLTKKWLEKVSRVKSWWFIYAVWKD